MAQNNDQTSDTNPEVEKGHVDHELGAEQDHHSVTFNNTQDHVRNMNSNVADHARDVNAAATLALQNAVRHSDMMANSFGAFFNLNNLIAVDRTWNLDEVSTLVARSGAVRDAIAAEVLRILSQQGQGNQG